MGEVIQFRKPVNSRKDLEDLLRVAGENMQALVESICVRDVMTAKHQGRNYILNPHTPGTDEHVNYYNKAKSMGMMVQNPVVGDQHE